MEENQGFKGFEDWTPLKNVLLYMAKDIKKSYKFSFLHYNYIRCNNKTCLL